MYSHLTSKPENFSIILEELEAECLNTIKYIEALKISELSPEQKEDLIGELSVCVSHLRIQTNLIDKKFEENLEL